MNASCHPLHRDRWQTSQIPSEWRDPLAFRPRRNTHEQENSSSSSASAALPPNKLSTHKAEPSKAKENPPERRTAGPSVSHVQLSQAKPRTRSREPAPHAGRRIAAREGGRRNSADEEAEGRGGVRIRTSRDPGGPVADDGDLVDEGDAAEQGGELGLRHLLGYLPHEELDALPAARLHPGAT